MEKMKMHTPNRADENFRKLAELFPNAVTESIDENGEVVRAIDKDVLMQEINTKVVEGREERYQFTWPDKKKSVLLANAPINKTLRPCREESVGKDGANGGFDSENLYIEGDNKEVLKVIQESYLNKIKFIYIDPPYNTGTNIIYKNDFSIDLKTYIEKSNQLDIDNNMIVTNLESNGRFHTDWLNIIFPVLRFAKNLLTEDGYIAIAIDDNELYNLKKICDEVFGENNYIGTIVTRCNPQGRNKNNLDPVHEYHLIYSKNILDMPLLKIKKEKNKNEYGYLMRSGTNSRKNERPYRFYPILEKNGEIYMIDKDEYKKIYNPKDGFNELFINELKNKYEKKGYRYILPISKEGEEKVWQRTFERVSNEYKTYIYDKGQVKVPAELERTPVSLWQDDIYSNVSYGTNKLKQLFGDNKIIFDFSKSIYTVKDLISLNTKSDDIILDFFPGSATTAHAVMQLNAEDGGNRKFIMVQLPEKTDEKSEAYKVGYKNICEIGKERIRRAGQKIRNEQLEKIRNEELEISNGKQLSLENSSLQTPNSSLIPDIGFRVLKCASSNMKDVYYNPAEFDEIAIDGSIDNIKEDRTPEDLLFQVMLDLGVLLSSKIEEKIIDGKKVFDVAEGFLVACFDDNITNETITEIAKQQPYYFVMRDSSIANDSVATNFEQIFATYSPDTVRKVL